MLASRSAGICARGVMRLDVCIALSLLAVGVVGTGTASAQISDDVVRIGVLNDQSNVYADLGGQGSVIAARMAIDDVGGKVFGKPIEILVADHQSKADVGASIARQWFDSEKVDLAIGFDNSSVALAVEQVAFQKNRIAIAGAIGTTAFTGKACTPNEAAWVYDAYALTNTLARSVVKRGQDTWYFITVDYSLGHSLEAVFGFKPTFGVVSVHPHSPAPTLWHQGPLTRTVSDAALMLTVMAGPDIRDWYAGPELSIDYRNGSVMVSKGCGSRTAAHSAMPSQLPSLSVWSTRQSKIWSALGRV